MFGVIEQCVCGKQEQCIPDPASGSWVPRGWYSGALFHDGRFRYIIACSADCVHAAIDAAKQHHREEAERFCKRIDEIKLTRVK